ncbi:hypothetical protein LDENG_00115020 [Lucifuga dentata]|nr:hypothetical protein LDENG_00115020 [Lucifuga dentata]
MHVVAARHGEADAPFLQELWECVRGGQKEILLSPLLPASCAFLAHILFCAPFLALDALGSVSPWIRSWRISAPDAPLSLRCWCDCFWRILLKYVTAVLPASTLFQSLRSPTLPELAPTCRQLFVEVVACLLVFDLLFFLWHLFMHRIPWLYRNIHQLHHQHQTPFAMAAQDASSAELLSLLFLGLSSAWLVGWLAVEDHCGYDLPWALHGLLPCLGGAPHHQNHHRLKQGNYAPYFTHWDHLCGTYIH